MISSQIYRLSFFFGIIFLALVASCLELSSIESTEKSIKIDDTQKSTGPSTIESNQSPRQLQIIEAEGPASCNMTLYQNWANERYVGVLSSDVDFWIYQTQPQVVLTNALALQLVVIFCKRQFTHLYFYKAGQSGPITIQNAYKPMCSTYCLQSDILHQRAMAVSGCDCLELSTQPTSDAYTAEGDWCTHNSGRLLCDMVGYCGVWECDINDFMCPRYEWNKKQIPYIGPGTCTSGTISWRKLPTFHFVAIFVGSILSFIVVNL